MNAFKITKEDKNIMEELGKMSYEEIMAIPISPEIETVFNGFEEMSKIVEEYEKQNQVRTPQCVTNVEV